MRVYLYVDGENFAIRVRELDAEIKGDPGKAAQLAAQVKAATGDYSQVQAHDARYLNQWAPEPHRDVVVDPTRTQNGILYAKDEVYWDALGLYLAIGTNMLLNRGQPGLIDRAYYFASAAGPDATSRSTDATFTRWDSRRTSACASSPIASRRR